MYWFKSYLMLSSIILNHVSIFTLNLVKYAKNNAYLHIFQTIHERVNPILLYGTKKPVKTNIL
jgi:hypothetical protein